MKNLYLRTSVALACAFGLAACGGGGDDLLLVISPIYGLTRDGLTIRNNGGTPEPIAAGSGVYTMLARVGTDSDYNIEIVTQPPNATCVMINGQGKTASYAPIGIGISCIATPHNVSATVTGLTGTGLEVVNGAMRYPITANGVFNFTLTAADGTKTGQVGDGNAYGYVILTQPTGQSCVVENGGGIMGSTDVTNINIKCV